MIETLPQTETKIASDAAASGAVALRIRYRIRFAKTGLLRWIGHTDLIRLWERMSRRARLPLSMSQGFHRRPRMAFPSALALGVIGLDEVAEIELSEDMDSNVLLGRLIADEQPGLSFASALKLAENCPKAILDRSDYVVSVVEMADLSGVQAAIERLRTEKVVSFSRKKKTIATDVGTEIPTLEVDGSGLRFTLVARDAASIRPDDLLELLGLGDWTTQGATITRTRVHLRSDTASTPTTQGYSLL